MKGTFFLLLHMRVFSPLEIHWLPKSLTSWATSSYSSSTPIRDSSWQFLSQSHLYLVSDSPSLHWVLKTSSWHLLTVHPGFHPISVCVSLLQGRLWTPESQGPGLVLSQHGVWLGVSTWWIWLELSLCMWLCRVECGCSFFVLFFKISNYLAEPSFGWNEKLFAFFLLRNVCALLCFLDS